MKKNKAFVFFVCCLFFSGFYVFKPQTPSRVGTNKIIDKELLLLMESDQTPIFASAQILRLMQQKNVFSLVVFLKNMPRKETQHFFLQEWKPFIDQGRLALFWPKNTPPPPANMILFPIFPFI